MTTRQRAARPDRRSRRAETGFSLIEIMFALAFLGVGLMAIAQTIPLATHQIVTSKMVSNGVAAGQAKMEELRMEPYSSALLSAGSHGDTTGHYVRSWVVQDNVPMNGTKRVDLTVSWTSSAGIQTAHMATLVTR